MGLKTTDHLTFKIWDTQLKKVLVSCNIPPKPRLPWKARENTLVVDGCTLYNRQRFECGPENGPCPVRDRKVPLVADISS